MTIKSRIAASLELAWDACAAGIPLASTNVPEEIVHALHEILEAGDAPPRQMTLTILASVAENPESSPASLQLGGGGVDRRGEAAGTVEALTNFKVGHGLTLKISKDPGVSHPFREPEVSQAWAEKRRGRHRRWAVGMLQVVTWLEQAATPEERVERAKAGLVEAGNQLVRYVLNSALNYPRFRSSPHLAMSLVRDFVAVAPDRPDAVEAIVTVAARSLAEVMVGEVVVVRGDVNSPDPIDIVLRSADGSVAAGIEVTDERISRSKLEHEVLDAMLVLGLDSATVVSRGVSPSDAPEIELFVARVHKRLGKRIDLVTLDIIESWLSFPGAPTSLSTNFLWAVGEELDNFSNDGNRRAWYEILSDFARDLKN